MDFKIVIPVIISFVISVILAPVIIPFLRRLKASQTERTDGVKSHLSKAGTPTMGGLIFLIAVTVTSLLYIKDYPKIIPILFLTLGFGLIGFLDDYLKVVLKRHGYYWNIGWVAVPLLFVAVIGTVNGVNFTDGLDGLASSVTVMVATFFTVVAVGTQSGIEPITCAVVGALMVFMGDTGSLALGGFVAGTAYMLQMPLFLILVGLIYLIEVASVIIQVTYFKKTGGKRFFKMAPIHHHFELCGWSETRVVAVFSIITAILCMIGLLAL